MTTDTERLDWLERNLIVITHTQASHTVYMSGVTVIGQLLNEARGDGAGPTYFRVSHASIREAIDDAMQQKNE